jgi:flagellar motor protein MotB
VTINRNLLMAGLFLALSAAPAAAQPKDVEGSKDSPLVSRYPGSIIIDYKTKEFDEFNLPVSKITPQGGPKTLHLEGKVTHIRYTFPHGRSTLEIYRNYETALKRAGFETVFACSGDCGLTDVRISPDWGERWYGESYRQLSSKLARPEGDLYVSLLVGGNEEACLDFVEIKPMEGDLVTVDAAALKSDIGRSGHAAVYGIYFDTGKADVKPESTPALQEIAKLLRQEPGLKLYIVGHTDSVGEFQMNMDLSRRRADAVLKALTATYGVAAERLQAYGDGPLAPVASNRDEQGRAKNRRVELVER